MKKELIEKMISRNTAFWLYAALFFTWLAFCIMIAAFFVSSSIKDAQSSFTQYSNAYAEHIFDKVSTNQVILEGFSALYSAHGHMDSREASHYAKQVIKHHPHIYSLEIVQAVPREALSAFLQQQRKIGHTDFQIRTFGYGSDKKWHIAEDKPVYYPIVFMEPMRPESKDVLGLDVGSVAFLRLAILESIQKQCAVSSHPFHLVEGNLAYVIFTPVASAMSQPHGKIAMSTASPYTVDMVVDATRIGVPDNMPLLHDVHLVVYHPDFSPDDAAGQIVHIKQAQHSALEKAFFPEFKFQKKIGPGFNILAEKQTGWSDINLPLLGMMLFATFISSAMLLAFIRSHHRNSMAEVQSKKNLWFLANHDILTQLPNRNLFMNRMEHAIARAQRQGTNFGILFIDLDGFKQVNDTYGHDTGDQLLKMTAKRLQACIRADDSVARLGGDEFVVLLEGITDDEVMESLAQKIRNSLCTPYIINSHQVSISASIGKAIFPMQGKSPDELLKFADSRMYSEKKRDNTAAP